MEFRPVLLLLPVTLAGCAHSSFHDFRETLEAKESATMALSEWCAMRKLANPPIIKAELVKDRDARSPAGLRDLLGVGSTEPLAYRHVRLSCGGKVLSEAHNWYVPSRLTPAMNEKLSATDMPFGMVAARLDFKRKRLSEKRGRDEGCPVGTILSHRALLRIEDKVPLALVVECYTSANMARAGRRATVALLAGTGR